MHADWPNPHEITPFYNALAEALANAVPWDHMAWSLGRSSAMTEPVLFSAAALQLRRQLPASLLTVADAALLHRDDDRAWRVHRMVARVLQDARHWDDVLHPEHVHLQRLARQVQRDQHKMKAFVRFTRVGTGTGDEYVAWFEPQFFITQAVAPFFARRFASMRWSILTPLASVRWDGQAVCFGPGADRSMAPPPDAGEALWLAYYEHIFNPSRVKVSAMKKEMPVFYWKNLPEATRIAPMLAQAAARSQQMIEHAQPPKVRRLASKTSASGACAGVGDDAIGGGETQGAASVPEDEHWARLRRRLAQCEDCPHALDATQTVLGEGPQRASLVIVGEQPGDREDLEGRPFVGPAGQWVRHALQRLGIDENEVYLTNAVKHFRYEMRGKRRIHKTPGQREVLACRPWLAEELDRLKPHTLVALGRVAAESLSALGHTPHRLTHPAALLRMGETLGSPGFERWLAQWRMALESSVGSRGPSSA